ncbi:hypothetical protein HAN_3g378 (nucleomorph) [Hemiselmis andersenii]|uniref:Uncharacterized protein n=1 Tax=Hemiselmis andersenii TaxID=464988 RepID=A9BL06_HEMAN|nr:hypothetical protein HAN_3g378 [Hemiselmis andersenii]ABW98189.1 hypothetical protein HAN_3g378 [Hemiselmis andersenii]
MDSIIFSKNLLSYLFLFDSIGLQKFSKTKYNSLKNFCKLSIYNLHQTYLNIFGIFFEKLSKLFFEKEFLVFCEIQELLNNKKIKKISERNFFFLNKPVNKKLFTSNFSESHSLILKKRKILSTDYIKQNQDLLKIKKRFSEIKKNKYLKKKQIFPLFLPKNSEIKVAQKISQKKKDFAVKNGKLNTNLLRKKKLTTSDLFLNFDLNKNKINKLLKQKILKFPLKKKILKIILLGTVEKEREKRERKEIFLKKKKFKKISTDFETYELKSYFDLNYKSKKLKLKKKLPFSKFSKKFQTKTPFNGLNLTPVIEKIKATKNPKKILFLMNFLEDISKNWILIKQINPFGEVHGFLKKSKL